MSADRWKWKQEQAWRAGNCQLTEPMLRAFYEAVPDRAAMLRAVGAESMSQRRCDKALQLLRKAGLIRYARGRWEKVP